MPPRLSLARKGFACYSIPTRTAFIIPQFAIQSSVSSTPHPTNCRRVSILSRLSDNRGAYNKKIRRGRGPSSGKGKTSGRGHKGQKQHGKVPAGFNGGQTPDEVVKGSRGFVNGFSVKMSTLNVDRLQEWIDTGRIDPRRQITLRELCRSRCLHGIKDGVKLLARNKDALRTPIDIVVSRASAAAIAAVEAAGGTIQTRFYTKQAIGRIKRGLTHPTLSLQSQELQPDPQPAATGAAPSATTSSDIDAADSAAVSVKAKLESLLRAFPYRLPDPTSRKDMEYYRDPAHRGYMAYQLKEGEGPSLYFRTPVQRSRVVVRRTKKAEGENRVW